MSTKIHNGFRLKGMNLKSLQKWTMDFRQKIANVNKSMIIKQRAAICAELIDIAFIYDSSTFSKRIKSHELNLNSYPLIAARCIMDDRQREIRKTKQRDPEYDYDCELVVIPVKSYVLGIPYTERKEHMKILEAMPGYEEYGYWNNTDKPKELSNYQWDTRCKNWDLALPGIGIPAHSGFIVQCESSDWHVNQSVIPHMPSLTERIDNIIGDAVSNYFRGNSYRDYLRWIESPEYKSLLASTRDELTQILQPYITQEDVTMSFKEIYEFFKIAQ